MFRQLTGVLLLSLLVACGGGSERLQESGPSVPPRPSPTQAVDNKSLAARDLEDAARKAFRAARTGRATFDLRGTRGRLEWAGSRVRLTAENSFLSFEAIGSGDLVYVRYGRIKRLTVEEQRRWDRAVGRRWIRNTERDEVADFVYSIQRSLANGFTTGPGPARARSVEPRRVRGEAAVGFTFPKEKWTVYVRRFGEPVPLRVDAGPGGLTFLEFGQDLDIEIPSVQQTLTLRGGLEDLRRGDERDHWPTARCIPWSQFWPLGEGACNSSRGKQPVGPRPSQGCGDYAGRGGISSSVMVQSLPVPVQEARMTVHPTGSAS